MSFDDELAEPAGPAPEAGPGWLDMDAYPDGDPDSVASAEQLATLGAALRSVSDEDMAALADEAAWGQMLDRAVAVEDPADVTAGAFDDESLLEPRGHDQDDSSDDGDDDWAGGEEWDGDATAFDADDSDAGPDDPHAAADADLDQP